MNFNNNYFNQNKSLLNIGTKLSDFEQNFILLGEGSYGKVVKRKSKIDHSYYAIKQLDNKFLNLINFQRETEILKNINHKNIVKFYGFFEDNNIYYLVFEFAQNGSLNDYIDKYKSKFYCNQEVTPLNENFVIRIFKDVLDGLKYLHSNNILHRDIKPDNILLDENMNAKIADFGISALYNINNRYNYNNNNENILFMNNTRIGCKDYISPEIIQGRPYDYKTDIFSLGLTIFYIMSFNLPFYNKKVDDNNIERKYNGNMINQFYNIHLRNLVVKMLNDNPDYRPTAFQVYDELLLIEQNTKNSQNNNQSNQNQNYMNFQNFQNNQNYNYLNNNNNCFQQVQNNQNQYNQNIQNYSNNQDILYQNYINQNQINNQNFNNQEFNNQNFNKSNFNNQNFNNPNFNNYQIRNQNNPIINQNQNQNLINNNINNKEIKENNNSILRVIECLYNIKELNLENIKTKLSSNTKINNSFIPFQIINLIELIGKKLYNKIDKNNFINKKNEIKNKLSSFFEKLNKKDIKPLYIFSEIFNNFNVEFINAKIFWNNKILNKIIEIDELPNNSFPEIYKKIKEIKNEYKNPFIDIFYYISLNLIKCPDCKNIYQADIQFNYSLNISIKKKDNITNIIKNYMIQENSKENCKCATCFYRGPGENEKAFYISPKYLIINFEDNNKIQNSFEEVIDLSSYILTDIGPKKYTLFALINKENNGKYISFIRNEKSWFFCSNEDSVEECAYDSINYGISSIAIYKGLD